MPTGWIDGWWNLEANRLVLRRSSRVTRPPRGPDHVSYSLRDGPDGMCYNLCNLDKVSISIKLFVGGP